MQMTNSTTVAHALHDTGLAAWFGGSLMGTVGLNAAASEATDPKERAAIGDAGWARWTPWSLAAIGAHLAGATMLTVANRRRIVRAAIPDPPSARRTTRPSPLPRRCAAMNSNTSAGVTSTGSLSITEKNTLRSDTVASTVFGRHRAATNST